MVTSCISKWCNLKKKALSLLAAKIIDEMKTALKEKYGNV